MSQQLHLFAPAKPLLLRFGADFFRAVPQRPGVYIMGGETDRVLYIGQSKNLRHRLGSYKNARPDRAPRKIIRLVHSVRTIVWEECATAEDARLRENQLLRIHRPKFNVQNTYPQAYGFIALETEGPELILRLSTAAKSAGKIFGAFKSGSVRAYTALLRLIWTAAHQPVSPFDFPAPLLHVKPPREYRFPLDALPLRHGTNQWPESLENFLAGESDELIGLLTEMIPALDTICACQRSLHARDLEVLTAFFERGPKRNRDLRMQHGIPDPIILQDELDDLLVTMEKKPPPLAPAENGSHSSPSETTLPLEDQ